MLFFESPCFSSNIRYKSFFLRPHPPLTRSPGGDATGIPRLRAPSHGEGLCKEAVLYMTLASRAYAPRARGRLWCVRTGGLERVSLRRDILPVGLLTDVEYKKAARPRMARLGSFLSESSPVCFFTSWRGVRFFYGGGAALFFFCFFVSSVAERRA